MRPVAISLSEWRHAAAFSLCMLTAAAGAHGQDRTTYAEGSRPKILINWESFEREGFPPTWRIPFQNVVINAYTRLNQVLAVDVRPQFAGYTTNTESAPGEIVISANERHANSTRLASTFGFFPDRLIIVIHRKRGSDLTPWNWTPFWPNSGEFSMYAVLMHELQHCLGLDHSAATKNIMGSYGWTSHHGPWSGDIDDTRALYGLRSQDRLRQLASYDGGASWANLSNDITNFGAAWGRTTNRIAAAGNHGTRQYLVGWATPDNKLTWVAGDGVSYPVANWRAFTVHPRPRFGSALESDNSGTWLWAVVDGRNDDNKLKVIRSRDGGATWTYMPFPDVQTYSTPGIARTRVGSANAWVVLWVNYNEADQANTGFIFASVSFNEGDSWSAPHAVSTFYRAHDGISLSATDAGVLHAAFTWAGESGTWEYGQNKLRTFICNVSSGGTVTMGALCIRDDHSRQAPDLAWHSTSGNMVFGFREQDYNTSLNSMRGMPGSCQGPALHIGGSTSHVAPVLAENRGWQVVGVGTEVLMWGARE